MHNINIIYLLKIKNKATALDQVIQDTLNKIVDTKQAANDINGYFSDRKNGTNKPNYGELDKKVETGMT